jgi:hypothetical protein
MRIGLSKVFQSYNNDHRQLAEEIRIFDATCPKAYKVALKHRYMDFN